MSLVAWLAIGVVQAHELQDAMVVEDYPNDWNFLSTLGQAPLVGDFDGDGRSDLLRPSPLASFVFSSTGAGSYTGVNVPYGVGNFGTDRDVWKPLTGDFTGDGSDDLLYLGTDTLWLHESNDFSPAFSWWDQSHPNGWRFATTDLAVVGDFTGDGIDDVVRPAERRAYLLVGRGYTRFDGGGGFYSPPAAYDFASGAVRAGAADVDGDGSDELIAFGPGFISVVNLSETAAQPRASWLIPNGWLFNGAENTPLLIGDMNGDGRDDIARFSASAIYTFLSTPTGFEAFSYTVPNSGTFPESAQRVVGDFNGDGLADLARRITGRTYVYLADGAGSWTEVAMPVANGPSNTFVVAGDVDGNGTDDLLFAGAIQLGSQRFFVTGPPDVAVDQAFATALGAATVDLQVTSSDGPVEGAVVRAHLEDATGTTVAAETSGVTNVGGTASLSWALGLNVPYGTYDLVVDVEATATTLASSSVFEIVVDPAVRNVSIPSLLPATYGDPPFMLPLQAPSGAIVDIQASGDCSSNGDRITVTGAGNCTVTATVEADPYYGSASADGFFSILPAPLTITVEEGRRVYGGDSDPQRVWIEGLVQGETRADLDGILTISEPAPDADVGVYLRTPSGLSSDDYDITFVPGLLAIEPRPLVVSATSSAVPYGSGPLAVELSYQGFAPGESPASLQSPPTVQHDAGDRPDAGTYTLRITPGVAGNYTIIPVDGLVTVYPAPLLVGVADTTVLAGEPVPEPVLTYLGFRYDDGPELFAPPPVVTVTAPDAPPPGAYERAVTGADHPNYETFYDDGLLLVVDGAAVPDEVEPSGCSQLPLAPFGVFPWVALVGMQRRRSEQG